MYNGIGKMRMREESREGLGRRVCRWIYSALVSGYGGSRKMDSH